MAVIELLTRWAPVVVVAGAIGAMLLWGCWFQPRQVARKRKAEFLVKFLKEFVEPELYEMLNRLPEDLSFTLGITPGPATTSYQAFDALGGVRALRPLPGKVQWWERTLERLARKFDLEIEYARGYSECKHPIIFSHPTRFEALEAYAREKAAVCTKEK